MKRALLISLMLISISTKVVAFDLDMTVDDDIRKNYNSSKLVKDTHTENLDETLPALPEISKYKEPEVTVAQEEIYKPPTITQKGNVKIHAGTTFDVVNNSKISDWQKKGNTVKFYVKTPITRNKYTIPVGTVFTGKILESHQPQITCNGGLVVIRIQSMTYKGQTIPINAYVTKANSQKVFLNNIKGDRTYLETTWKKGNWGRTLFNRMMTLTVNLGGEGSTLILSPFPLAYGAICLGLNTLTSPICAFFQKGGHVSIPAGSSFRIRLLDSAYIF